MKKTIYYFLLLQPILDILISLQQKYLPNTLSIGLIIRGILFLLITIYLFKDKSNRKYIYSYLIFILIYLLYDIFILKSIIPELSNIFQIFYLPFLILFFSKFDNEKINKKFIIIIYFILLNSLLIPYIFGIGFNISEMYSNKEGYIGLYNGGNEISAVLLTLLPIIITYLREYKNKIINILFIIEYTICIILIGTKTLLLGSLIIIFYFFYKQLKNKKIILISGIIIILLSIILLPHTPIYKNIKTSLDYYKIDSPNDIFKNNNIDNIIFSRRLYNSHRLYKTYKKSNILNKILGIGRTKILTIKDVEIDIFDIFYSIGILGLIYYLLLLFNIIKNTKLYGIYKFSFILLLIISFFSGHILFKPQVSIYLALLFFLNKYDEDYNKKRILLVSNMYPTRRNKHYGSFVKNVYNLLVINNIIVDKITIDKYHNKIMKLLSYIKLHSLTILYGIFNHYDYIYVHFISHSSTGAVIVKKIKPNIKLVLNAHGNDIVPDIKIDEKNVIRSKKYLRYADTVVVPSNYFKNVLIKEYKVNKDIIFIYPSGGVDTNMFIPIDKKEAKKQAWLDEKTKYIGYISRIENNKGYDTFIKMINELKNEKYKFIILGKGDEEPNMLELIRKYKIEDKITRLDMIPQKDLVYVYNSLELFIFPTYRKSESLGLVGLEAMSCKVPVIAANNYGPTDYIEDNINGFYFKPKDYKDLAKRVKEVLKKKDINKILDNARKTAIKYDINNTKNRILEVFK